MNQSKDFPSAPSDDKRSSQKHLTLRDSFVYFT